MYEPGRILLVRGIFYALLTILLPSHVQTCGKYMLCGWLKVTIVEVYKIFQFESDTGIIILLSLMIIKIKWQWSLFLYGLGFASEKPGQVNVCLFSCWMFPLGTLWIRGSSWVCVVVNLSSSLVFDLPHCMFSPVFNFSNTIRKGQALQFNYLFEKGAFILRPDETFAVDFEKVWHNRTRCFIFTQFFQWSHWFASIQRLKTVLLAWAGKFSQYKQEATKKLLEPFFRNMVWWHHHWNAHWKSWRLFRYNP